MSAERIKQTKQNNRQENPSKKRNQRTEKNVEKEKSSAKETQTAVSRFFTTIAVPESLIANAQEDPIELSWKQKWFGSFFLIFLFLFIFILGIVWFFPLNRLLVNFLNKDYSMLSSSVEKVDASFLGNIALKNYRLKFLQTPPKEIFVKQLDGKIAPLPLVLGKESAGNFTLHNLSFKIPVATSSVRLYNGKWQIHSNVKINREQPELSEGKIKIFPENVFVSYDDIVPMINEKIQLLIKEGTLDITIENQTANIAHSEIFTDLFHVSLQGQVPFSSNGALSLDITLKPQDLFFKKYSQNGIEQILRTMNILKEDNTIRIGISGNINNPQVQTN